MLYWDMVCRYCDGKVEHPVETFTYWNHNKFFCHAECKVAGERQEATDCQTIDANCNDCKHYDRKGAHLPPKTVSWIFDKNMKKVSVTHQTDVFYGGKCLKFNKIVEASPNEWKGLKCFEHRRS